MKSLILRDRDNGREKNKPFYHSESKEEIKLFLPLLKNQIVLPL